MLMLLWTGCQTGEGSPGVEDASTTAHADSLKARVVEEIRTRVESEVNGLEGLPPDEESRPLRMMRWYEETGFQPLWVDGTGPLPVVERLLDVLTSAADEGLSPEAYPAGRIEQLVRAVQSADSVSVADLVELELLCTSARAVRDAPCVRSCLARRGDAHVEYAGAGGGCDVGPATAVVVEGSRRGARFGHAGGAGLRGAEERPSAVP
jgi:hypothetical protein